MKKRHVLLAPALAAALQALCASPGSADVLLTADNAEVVVAPDASPITVFAAEEMTNFLSRVLGGTVPLARAPSDGRVSVVVGDNAWSAAAGVDPKGLPRDSYVVKTSGSRVYIAGVDRPDLDWDQAVKMSKDCERATLFGVYGWLQEKAGVRFIWPDDELGTIVPSMKSIALADGVQTVSPDFVQRNPYFHGDGKLRPWPSKTYAGRSPKGMLWMRHRLSTFEIPCCHGSCHFQYVQRFAGSHPEYLSRLKDGSVHTNMQHYGASQLCWTNPGLRETLYQDVKAYLSGQQPGTRGLKRWGQNCRYGRYVDIMPDDGFRGCFCPGCQTALAEGRRKYGKQYATDLVWGVCRDIGNRLIAEGIPGSITMMAYTPYSAVPSFDLPTNVEVMVALRGPWSLVDPERHESDSRRVSAWAKKVGHRVLTWTYPHKYNATAIKGIPCSAPHAWGRYYAAQRDVSVGGFVECEAGSSFYNFLNYYVFSHVMWDSSTDIDALLDEAYRLMFGRGAVEMKAFFELLEQKWTRDVAGHVIETDLGPQTIPPTQKEVWEKIYSQGFRKQLDGLLKAAASKVPADSLEARRLAVMRREFYDPMAEGLAEYEKLTTDVAACTFDISKGPIDVNVWRVTKRVREPATVKTRVAAELTADELVFNVDCMEPEMDDASCPYDEPGSEKLYNNNDVEIFLNPSADRRRIFHFVLCSNGAAAVGYTDRKSGKPTAWSLPDGVVWTARRTVSGWSGELRVRRELLADMAPAFPANFCRLRALKGRKAEMIMWNRFTFLFGDLEHFGTMIVSPPGR